MRRIMKFISVSLLLAVCTPAALFAQTSDYTDPQGFFWDIDSSYFGFVRDGTDDAYDGWPSSCVLADQQKTDVCETTERYSAAGVPPTGELDGRQVSMGAKTLDGLTVQRKVYVPATGSIGFARYMEILHNPTSSTKTIKVRVGSTTSPPLYVVTAESLGSDGETTIASTSAGTTTLEPGLQWFTTDDGTDWGGDPAIVHVVAGENGEAQMDYVVQGAYGRALDFIYWEYRNISIPAGETVILLHFQSQQMTRANALAVAQWLAGLPEEATYGMSTDELSEVINFQINLRPVAEANGPYSGAEGSAISLSAQGSYARTGTIVGYEWDCESDGTYDISTTDTSAECTYPVHGSYTVTLRVTDSRGSTATDTAAVTVTNLAPQISNVTVDNPGFEGDEVTFVATASDPGPGDQLTYSWAFGDGGTASGATVVHTYVDERSYAVELTVTDTAGATATYTTTVPVLNADPSIIDFQVPNSATEGSSVSFSGLASDPGADDVLTYTWAFGDGQTVGDVDLTSVSHTYGQDGTYTVMLTVTDGDGGSAESSMTIDITNVAPTIDGIQATQTGTEGSTFYFDGSASDPGSDTLSYAWDFGDGESGTGSSTTHIFANDGTYSVTLTVTDGDGGSDTGTVSVTVTNVAPQIVSLTGDTSGNEGATLGFTATGSDPGSDPLTYAWDFGDGATANGASVSHAFADDGTYTVTVTVSDDQETGGSDSLTVEVANVSPTISSVTGDFSGLEGQSLSYQASASDPGDDTLTYTWDFGDGSDPVAGVDLIEVSHTYMDVDTYTLTLVVSDEDGGEASVTRTVNVGNDAPSISSLEGDVTGNEGDVLAFHATASDPGGDTLVYTWRFDDGSGDLSGDDLADVTHVYADEGTYVLTLTVEDPGGLSSTASLEISVANVAPTLVDITTDEAAYIGSPVTFSAAASDPGQEDVLTYTWDFGDGSQDQEGSTTTHTYNIPDTYTVTVSVSDGDGGSDTGQFDVEVQNVPPTVGQIQGPTELVEGGSGTYAVEASTPSGDLVYAWDFGDGTSSNEPSPTHTFPVDGTYTITLTVSDHYGGSVERQLEVVVANAPPAITSVSIPGTADQGELVSFSVSASDPGDDPLRYRWDFGDGETAASAQATHRFPATGTYDIVVTVFDDTDASDSRTAAIEVANVAPVIEAFSVDATGREGEDISAGYSASDASGIEPSATIDWGDGTTESMDEDTLADHVYADDGTYEVTLTVTDSDGETTSRTASVAIDNVAPTITSFDFPTYGEEGETFDFTASGTDPAGEADPLTFGYDFGDGSEPVSGIDLTAVSHTYLSSGNYTVTLTLSDDDGGVSTQTGTINVGTAAPFFVKFEGDTAGDEGDTLSFQAQAMDPVGQTLVYRWDFGDGTDPLEAEDLENTTHLFADDGIYTVTVTVIDPDELTAAQSLEVSIANVAPSFTSDPPTTAMEGVTYTYQAEATDPGGEHDPLLFTLTSGPDGMSMTGDGLLTWTPTLDQAGTHDVAITVQDDEGATATQQWTVMMDAQDQDQDDMPDTWETQNGLDPTDPGDAAEDPDGDGITNLEEFLNGTDPMVSNGPGAPGLDSPVGGTHVATLTPALVVTNADDPDGDLLTYEFEVYADANLTEWITGGEVAQAAGTATTEFVVDVLLDDNTDVWWRARARDAYIAGPWSDIGWFFVSLTNDPPTAPVPNLPADGATVGSATPNLEVLNAVDLDRDLLTYQFEVFTATDGSTPVAGASGVAEGAGGTTSWQVPDPLPEGIEYVWHCRASDQEADGDWSAWSSFVISTYNGPPSAPTILYPYSGTEVTTTRPEILLDPATDPEGDALTYYIEVFPVDESNPAPPQSSEAIAADPDGQVRWTPPEPLADNAGYRARAMADDGESTSDWVSVDFFVNTANDPPQPPTLQNPSDGSNVDEGDIVFTLVNAVDVDGDPLTYTFVISDESGAETLRIQDVPEDGSGMTSTTAHSGDLGGPGTYSWTAFATDDEGLEGESAVPNNFHVGGGAPTPTPGADDTAYPGDDDTTYPGDDDTTYPGDDDTTYPGDDDTASPGDDDTSLPGDDDATSPPAGGGDGGTGGCDCSTGGPGPGNFGWLVIGFAGIAWVGRKRRFSSRDPIASR